MTGTLSWFSFDSPPVTSLAITLFVVALTTWYLTSRRKRKFPPGPTCWQIPWFLFQLDQLNASRLAQLARKYGDVFSLTVGTKQVVVLSSIEVVRETFIKHESTFSGRPTTWILNLLNNGSALATRCYDKTWKRQRAFTTFVHRNLCVGSNSNLQNVLNVEVSNFLGHLQALHGAPFKPNVIVLKASMNVFCGILFDRRFEYDDSRLEELVNKLNDFDSEIQGNHDMFTYMQFSWYLLYSRKRRVQKVYSDLLGLLADLIDEQTETHVEGKIRHVLDVYIQEVTKQEGGERSIFEEDASPRDCLKHTIVEYFYTGAITLAKTMETLFMQIIERPDIQKRVRNEISNVKLVNGHRSPTIEDIENSRFSYATILEVLRLYPVESISWPRCSTRDGVIGGYGIPKGTVILTNIYAIHRDSRHWDNPDEFNPQRFIDMSTGKVQLNERSAFLPWSIGPRKCVGEVISRLVVWSFFASVMQRFQLITPNDKNGNQELLNGYMPYVFARNKIETVEICAVETTKAVHTTKVK